MGAEEEVDVVDAADCVTGRTTRARMRAGKLRHRAVYVLIFNERGQLFVHQRAATKDVYPSRFDVVVGGVVGAGESYDDAARREAAEEVGIYDTPLRRILPFQYEDEENRVNGMVYSCTYEGPLTLQAEEIVSGEWLDLDEVIERIQKMPFCPDGVEALYRYLDRLASVQSE